MYCDLCTIYCGSNLCANCEEIVDKERLDLIDALQDEINKNPPRLVDSCKPLT